MKNYRVTSSYGWRTDPFTHKRAFHAGIDLVNYHKAPIPVFVEGTVHYAAYGQSGSGLGGYGNVVIVRDGQGRGHLYAHLDSIHVRKGQWISKGQVIGTQGTTGNVTGSHLHYEVRKTTSGSHGWSSNKVTSTLDPVPFMKENKKSTKQLADEVLSLGLNGKKRKEYLGSRADEVQRYINKMWNSNKKSTHELYLEVMKKGLNGEARKKYLGSRANEVQRYINQRH